MPKHIQKSLHECLSKMKVSNKQLQFPIRSCRRIKTSSLSVKETNQNKKEIDAVSLSDIDRFLFENFKSLYREEAAEEEEEEEEKSRQDDEKTTDLLFELPGLLENPAPENLCSSARFFVASGSSSSSLTSATTNDTASASDDSPKMDSPGAGAVDFIALLTYSPSPYDDFRRSMQEMVDARVEHNGKMDWQFLEELLFCYLDLNNRKSYKYILRAFVDLIVGLRESSGRVPGSRPSLGGESWRKQIN
ncbi:hypothetical protein CASFOL_024850 [Castilleja foliolosa]|uniref:Transcription repressor n=1 Tax=Castilleja foliolosa TaxID=1961234 RepID=A0ABD3CPI6_9LAMI